MRRSVSRPLIARSEGMRRVVDQIEKAGRSRWPVLILGETGTGKEVIARAVHEVQSAGEFVVIDCSALSAQLADSELFGYVPGAFTGAQSRKIGLIERAHGGTAFFDEIGELPLEMQVKLLRVLQEGEYRPLGSPTPREADFRVISATHRDLNLMADHGQFRKDLLFRLKVMTMRLPALRERPQDVLALTSHFIGLYGNGHQVSLDLEEAMLAYSWPGNVRELENAVKSMLAVNSGPFLTRMDLPSTVQNGLLADHGLKTMAAAVGLSGGGIPRMPVQAAARPAPMQVLPLAEVERRHILHALEVTKGDRSAAADLLGISRATLYRRLRDYQIAV